MYMSLPSIDDLDLNSSILSNDPILQRQSMKTIDVFYVFIDSNHSIHFIECEKETLSLLSLDNKIGIQKDRLLQMIYKKKLVDGRKYKLFHMLLFNVGIDHSQLSSFLKQDPIEYKDFMNSPSCLTDLIVDDSLDIFHSLNSLFIFFYEIPPSNLRSRKTLRVNDSNKRITKKVRFDA